MLYQGKMKDGRSDKFLDILYKTCVKHKKLHPSTLKKNFIQYDITLC